MITSKQWKAIHWIENVLDIEYPWKRNNFYDASEFIDKYRDVAKARSNEIDAYRRKRDAELAFGITLYIGGHRHETGNSSFNREHRGFVRFGES